uniref:Germin-like protein n=1 Tax=Leersia perrieri TaxID=77586 RepID=A0A0D9W0B6_9ORYZ
MSPLLILTTILAVFISTSIADPDPIQDFCVGIPAPTNSPAYTGFPCKPESNVTSDDFYFTGLAATVKTYNRFGTNVSVANVDTFPGLNTMGLSISRIEHAPGGLNPPHTHPRATEMVHVIEGRILIGFVSTARRFYSKVLNDGDTFVIPRGMVHFEYNVGGDTARVMTAFNSQLPGVEAAAPSLFGTDPEIPDFVLTKSLQVDVGVIRLLKSKFQNQN